MTTRCRSSRNTPLPALAYRRSLSKMPSRGRWTRWSWEHLPERWGWRLSMKDRNCFCRRWDNDFKWALFANFMFHSMVNGFNQLFLQFSHQKVSTCNTYPTVHALHIMPSNSNDTDSKLFLILRNVRTLSMSWFTAVYSVLILDFIILLKYVHGAVSPPKKILRWIQTCLDFLHKKLRRFHLSRLDPLTHSKLPSQCHYVYIISTLVSWPAGIKTAAR